MLLSITGTGDEIFIAASTPMTLNDLEPRKQRVLVIFLRFSAAKE